MASLEKGQAPLSSVMLAALARRLIWLWRHTDSAALGRLTAPPAPDAAAGDAGGANMLNRPAISLGEFNRRSGPPSEDERANSVEVLGRVEDVFSTEGSRTLEDSGDREEFLPPDHTNPEIATVEVKPSIARLDVNVYAHKKTLAQGMMDLALLSANANQLRYVLDIGSSHPYYYPSTALIITSLVLQILVGVGLILISQYNIKKDEHLRMANKINNFTMIGIFLITTINVFISAFSISIDVPHHKSAVPSPIQIIDASDDRAVTPAGL